MNTVHTPHPTVCRTCAGDGVVGVVPGQQDGPLTTCPQCRCICGCGREVPMPGLAAECWDRDWQLADDTFRRAADR